MIYIGIAVVIMFIIAALIIIPDKIPVIRNIRKEVEKHDQSNGFG